MKPITKSVFRKLFRMKLRLVGISMVIALAMSMFVAGFYAGEMYDYSIDKYFEDSKMPDIFFEFARQENQTDVENALAAESGVATFDVRLKVGGVYEYNNEKIAALVIGINNPNNPDINILNADDGSMFSQPGQAVAVGGMQALGIETGADVQVMLAGNTLNLSLTGLVSSPEWIFASAYTEYAMPIGGNLVVIFMDLSELQAFYGEGVNEVQVLLDGPDSAGAAGAALAPFGIKKATSKEDHPASTFMEIGAAKMRNMFPLMGVIFMIVGFISIFMTVYRLVKNDSRYIGVMMSLGYPREDIVRSYLGLGVVLTLIGGVFGTIFALGFTMMIVGVGAQMMAGLLLYFPPVYWPFALGWLFIVGAVMLSVVIPVSMITKMSVREALDYKPSMTVHNTRRFSGNMSRVTLMGLRNSTRNPGRMALTIFVVGMTIGVAGSWLVMADSAWGYMDELLDADTWDLRGDFYTETPEQMVNASFLGLNPDDVNYLIPFSHMTGKVTYGSNSGDALLVGCNDMGTARNFEIQQGTLDFSGAVITIKMANELGLGIGDTLEVTIGGATTSMTVSAIVSDMPMLAIYTNRANLDPFMSKDNLTGVFVGLNSQDESFVETQADNMRANPMVSKVVIQDNISESFNEVLDQALAFLYAFFAINLLIAFVVAGSAVIISTMERDVEFATLDTLGISRGKIAFSILAEMSVMATGAAFVGVPLAYFFGWILAKLMEDVIFYFPIIFIVGATVMIFMIGFIFVLMSAIVPIRYSKSLDTEKTLRERTAG